MADKTTLAQMLEHIVNNEQQKAEELFHEYVVAKSRDIYEGLIESELNDDDDDIEEDFSFEADDDEDGDVIGGDPTDDLESDLDAEQDDMDMDDDSLDMDMDDEDKDPEELFQDLDAIVDELQAKFDAMNSDDMGDDDMDMGDDDMDMGDDDMDMGDDDMDMDDDDEKLKDSFDSELATVREYVEKIGSPKMGDNGQNTKSIVAGKNDMGGTTANIAKGGQSKGEGTKGGLAAPTSKEDNAGNVNVPGGKAGVKHLKKQSGHGAEKKASGDNGDGSAKGLFRSRR